MSEVHINSPAIVDKNNSNNNNDINHGSQRKPPSFKKRKNPGGPMSIIKVALHKLRNKKGGLKKTNKSALSATTNTALTQIMGSVRPLYLQSSVGGEESPPPPPPLSQPILQPLVEGVVTMSPEQQETSSLYTASTSRSSSSRSSSLGGGMSSKYASALSLYDLDNHDDGDTNEEENDEEDHGDAYYESLESDALIDVKAELFIAKFYQQMRLHN